MKKKGKVIELKFSLRAVQTLMTKAQYDALRLAGFSSDESIKFIVRYQQGERRISETEIYRPKI